MAIVATRSGKVEGYERGGVQVFKGIPYAAPPVGALRWQMPKPEGSWDGVRAAKKFSPQCAQTEFALNAMMGAARPPYSEDSLYLNVWTPACDNARRPVMVWIHGGAFVWGAGDTPWYDGTHFAQHGDVVVVTINYRLGPFGFMHLDDLFPGAFPGAGNLGIADQIAALQWVRDSIGAFGGDPGRVTIFGESAGAGSVGTLLGTPAARGLFTGAIAQSGAASWIAAPEQATAFTTKYMDSLGVERGDVAALLAKSTDEILDAMPEWSSGAAATLPFQPVVDGVLLTEPPLTAIARGNATGVHVLTGTNRHEMTLFMLQDPGLGSMTDDVVRDRLTAILGERARAIVDDYRRRRPDAGPQELWLDIATDRVFRMPAIALLEAQAEHAPTWLYLFTYETPVFGGVLKSSHALEIPFVFDTLDNAEMFTGNGPELAGLAEAMHQSWIAFARTGDPNHPGLPAWPRYDTERRATMRFDTVREVLDDPAGADRATFFARTAS